MQHPLEGPDTDISFACSNTWSLCEGPISCVGVLQLQERGDMLLPDRV